MSTICNLPRRMRSSAWTTSTTATTPTSGPGAKATWDSRRPPTTTATSGPRLLRLQAGPRLLPRGGTAYSARFEIPDEDKICTDTGSGKKTFPVGCVNSSCHGDGSRNLGKYFLPDSVHVVPLRGNMLRVRNLRIRALVHCKSKPNTKLSFTLYNLE